MRWTRLKNSMLHLPTEWAVQKAKRKHRKAHPECSVCRTKKSINGNKCDVHHLIPVHVAPLLACEPSNLITICRRHHFWVGHMGNWKDHNGNVIDTMDALRSAYNLNAIRKVDKPKEAAS